MTGLSRAQVMRLIARYRKTGSLQSAPYRRHHFPQRYTRADIELLAIVDEAHDNLSGPATRRILEREYRRYGKGEFARLATLSVSHLYNLRQQPRYRERRLRYVKTGPPPSPSESGGGPIRRASPGICASTRSIKAIRQEGRAFITSMPWMRSRNGKSFLPAHELVRPGWSRCWRPCCGSFPSAFSAFTPITAASSSIA